IAEIVNRARQQLLSGPRLSEEQHGGRGRRHLLGLTERSAERGAAPDNVSMRGLCFRLGTRNTFGGKLLTKSRAFGERICERALRAGECQSGDHDSRDRANSLDRAIRPAAAPAARQAEHVELAPGAKRHDESRRDRVSRARIAIDGGFCGELPGAREMDSVAISDLCGQPRKLVAPLEGEAQLASLSRAAMRKGSKTAVGGRAEHLHPIDAHALAERPQASVDPPAGRPPPIWPPGATP